MMNPAIAFSWLTFFSSCVFASPTLDQELVTWRLEAMKSAMNARDFDLASYQMHQIEVLSRACELELKLKKLPFSCVEMRHKKIDINAKNKKAIFEVGPQDSIEQACEVALEKEDVTTEILSVNPKTEKLKALPSLCRSRLQEKLAILRYKKAGKAFE